MGKMTLHDVLQVANSAYPGNLDEYIADPDGQHGDSLAQFVVRELHDVCEGADDPLYEARCAIENAIGDLQSVLNALLQPSRHTGDAADGWYKAYSNPDYNDDHDHSMDY